jgi:hypothetical protein
MSQKNERESKVRKSMLPEVEEPDDMVFHAKSDEERMVIDQTLSLIASVPCLKGLKVLQKKNAGEPNDEYCMLSVVNLSVKPTQKDTAMPWILSLTMGSGRASSGHYKFYINKYYIFTKFSETCPFDKTHVLDKLAELNGVFEELKSIEEPKATATLKEKYVVTFFPVQPKRASPAAPTVIVQQQAAAIEPPTKKAKVASAPAKSETPKKKAPAKRTTPRRNVPAKAPLPLKSKDDDSETAAKSDDDDGDDDNQQEKPEDKKDASFAGSDAEGDDDDDDDDGDK